MSPKYHLSTDYKRTSPEWDIYHHSLKKILMNGFHMCIFKLG